MAPADLHPADLPRLFVGGLPPTLATSSVIRLLSKFVQPHTVHRHPTRPFAHISVTAADEGALARCIAALNNTTWCGTTLRVQKAVPHYWFRLTQEWKVQPPIQAELDTSLRSPNLDKDGKEKHQHFDTLPKGKHVVFDFPDLDHTDINVVHENETAVHTSQANCSGSHFIAQSNTNDHKSPTIAPSTSKPGPSKSTSLSSTMALFGLTSSPVPTQSAGPSKEQTQTPHRDHPESAEVPPLKRPRICAAHNAHDSERTAVQGGSDQVDLNEERKTALAVLRNMFPTDATARSTGDELITRNRRMGLFRKLDVTNVTQQRLNEGSNVATRKQKPRRLIPSSPTEPPPQRQGGPTQVGQTRRAGLYKKLASVTGGTNTAPDEFPSLNN